VPLDRTVSRKRQDSDSRFDSIELSRNQTNTTAERVDMAPASEGRREITPIQTV